MAQGYYTLEEAAQLLGMSEDELKMVARKGEIRSFQDRGTWRFRVQDIQEMARQRGLGSDPELPLGDALAAAGSSPADLHDSTDENEAFSFDFEDGSDEEEALDIGNENLTGGSSVRLGDPLTPAPGSDSDIRLVDDSEFELKIDELEGNWEDTSEIPAMSSSDHGDPNPTDSDARLVNMDSDSDVRIVEDDDSEEVPLGEQPSPSATDSEVRLEFDDLSLSDEGDSMWTEEIDLDAEMKSAGPPSDKNNEADSPFELTNTNLNLADSKSAEIEPSDTDGSSDFELTPESESESIPEIDMEGSSEFELESGQGSSDFELEGTSDFELTPASESNSLPDIGSSEFEVSALSDSDDVDLGGTPKKTELKGPNSGISLSDPLDSGISLEQESEGSDEFDFTLSVDDSGETDSYAGDVDSSSEFELTLAPDDSSEEMSSFEESSSEFELSLEADESSSEEAVDSSSEFELTIDTDDDVAPDLSSDSEFELTIDDDTDSSSEFELTIDDDAELVPDVVEDAGEVAEIELEEDVADFDLEPAMEDDSASEVVVLDEDETSDFDISLDESDMSMDDASASEVVLLDEEEEFDDAASTVAAQHGGVMLDDEMAPGFEGDDFSAMQEEIGEGYAEAEYDEEAQATAPAAAQAAPAAQWGPMPVIFMLPCVVIMFIVAIMGFEMVQSVSGHRQPGLFTKTFSGLILEKPIGE